MGQPLYKKSASGGVIWGEDLKDASLNASQYLNTSEMNFIALHHFQMLGTLHESPGVIRQAEQA